MGNNLLVRWGIITGVVSIIISLLIYMIDSSMFASMSLSLISLAVTIILLVMAGREAKKEGGGFLPFKVALRTTFGVFVVATIISTLFSMVLFNVIDPGLSDVIKEKAIENTVSMMEKFGAPEASIDEAIAQIEQQDFTSPGQIIKSMMFTLIFGFIIALIISAIIKKKPPEGVIAYTATQEVLDGDQN